MKGARRKKKRYLVIEGVSKNKIINVLSKYFGERSFGELKLKFISEKPLIIRITREYTYEAIGVLLLESINIKIVCITGSLKKAKKC